MNISFNAPIYFTGFMATGKSRLGELTAAALGWKHFDTDTLVEQKTDRSVTQIFEEDGEDYFRRLELQVIDEMAQKERVVVSLGGGALKSPEAQKIVKQSGILIGLWAHPETILKRVNRKDTRPLLSGLNDKDKLEKINRMLEERAPIYNLAHFQIESREDIPHHVLIKKIINRLQLERITPVEVDLGERSYPIYIQEDMGELIGVVTDKIKCPQQFLIVTDSNLKSYQKEYLRKLSISLNKCRIFYFKTGEKEKNLTSVNRLITYMLKHHYTRETTLVAFGGGIVGDVTGFTASIYLRGIKFLQVPTTLLAMVDSSVGGKTGVNHRLGKNLIGTFTQPGAVLINTHVLETLPREELLAGLAEVIKYAVLWDESFFTFLEENVKPILAKEPEVLKILIKRCCEIKAEVVSNDEREQGIRAILNYGHTFGHAIEAEQGYHGLSHGFAVALGMKVAARLSCLMNLLSHEDEKRQTLLLSSYGLPKAFEIDKKRAWDIMARDKKNKKDDRVYVLPVSIGKVKKVINVDKALVNEAWSAIDFSHTGPKAIPLKEQLPL
ncbi:MAG: 3-dehydroquinate synthase [Fibrobacteria bacterium]|nr:3-dehydroquinate synthase [Fibrobacteria bacterium]